jgi:aspartate aminotransferase
MAGRIAKVRGELRAALEKRLPDKDWSFVTKQIGMFSYTGMSPQQVGAEGDTRRGQSRGWVSPSLPPARSNPPSIHSSAMPRPPPPQVDNMTNKHAVFMTRDGRISLAGLSSAKVRWPRLRGPGRGRGPPHPPPSPRQQRAV